MFKKLYSFIYFTKHTGHMGGGLGSHKGRGQCDGTTTDSCRHHNDECQTFRRVSPVQVAPGEKWAPGTKTRR